MSNKSFSPHKVYPSVFPKKISAIKLPVGSLVLKHTSVPYYIPILLAVILGAFVPLLSVAIAKRARSAIAKMQVINRAYEEFLRKFSFETET